MSEFKNGDLVMVSDNRNDDGWFERRFIGIHSKGSFICESDGGYNITFWKYCKPVPKKTHRPFKDVFEVPVNAWFREKNQNDIGKLLGQFREREVTFSVTCNNSSFEKVLERKEMSTDGKEWTPAGVEE